MRTTGVLRVATAALAFAVLAAPAALANTFTFGSATNNTSCGLNGNGADRSCTHAITVGATSVNIRGQSSADHGLLANPTAIADMTVEYEIPYTVTRTVNHVGTTTLGGTPAELHIPIQTITLDMNFSGNAAHDSTQTFGGLSNAQVYTASVESLGIPGAGIVWGTGSYPGEFSGGNGNVETGGGFNRTTPDFSYSTGPDGNFTGPGAGEISFAFEIPTDYQDWQDFVSPEAQPPSDDASFLQSFSDTIKVSFRLRAESRPEGSTSATGGEAIACAGQTSPLGAFDVDNGLNCGSGFDISANVSVTSTLIQAVPEPSTALLVGGALAGLAFFGRRLRG